MSSPNGRNGAHEPENFAKFFEQWVAQQDLDLQDLLAVVSEARPHNGGDDANSGVEVDDRTVRVLVDRVMGHYENYYTTKSASAKQDVSLMFKPTWTSSLENMFFWVGGWRPSTAFHLLYSKSGLQLEPQLARLVSGLPTGDLSDLTAAQVERIDALHRRTIRLEREISEEEAAVQEAVADKRLVELAQAISERAAAVEDLEPEMKGKRERMERVLEQADKLRLDTLKSLVEILRPTQAVHFLIAAAELHLRVHEFGKKKDESNG